MKATGESRYYHFHLQELQFACKSRAHVAVSLLQSPNRGVACVESTNRPLFVSLVSGCSARVAVNGQSFQTHRS
jgi:hypothetical protein